MTESDNGIARFDFAHLEVEGKTSRYAMPLVGPHAVMLVHPASEFNRAYRDGLLAISGTHSRAERELAHGSTEDDEKEARKNDLLLFPTNVVYGWEGIVDVDGNPVDFSKENCAAFLRSLPDWLFDRLRVHCKLPSSFIRSPSDAVPAEPKALVKN